MYDLSKVTFIYNLGIGPLKDMMLWKIYTVIFFILNAVSLIVFEYTNFRIIPFISLALSCALNIAVFSYAFKKPILSKQLLIWLFKANIALFGLFLSFEFLTFIQELIGYDLLKLPTSGVVSIIASFPSLPALYATYRLTYIKTAKLKRKAR